MGSRFLAGAALAVAAASAHAGGVTATGLEEVVVTAGRVALAGNPRAASEGTVLHEQLENRPLLRAGEILEVVPGLIVTQHTGDGKANQYFLRGFNLDHGTDFLTRVEGMSVNMPTHGHGQGYMDLNFVIPELIERVDYHKGTYYPELGNFSAAGAAELHYFDQLDPVRLADRRRGRVHPRRRRGFPAAGGRRPSARTRVQHHGRSLGAAAGPAQDERLRELFARDGRGQLVAGLHGLRQRVDGDRPGAAARRAGRHDWPIWHHRPDQRRRVASLLVVPVGRPGVRRAAARVLRLGAWTITSSCSRTSPTRSTR